MLYNADQFMLEYPIESMDENRTLTELQKAEKTAKEHLVLFHYTSFETLKLILVHKNLKFNRIDKVNDRLEHLLFGEHELSHLVFVSCFSTDEMESIPMWSIYGKDENGVRISFELDTTDFVENLLDKQGDTVVSPPTELYRWGKLNVPDTDWKYTVCAKDIIYDFDAIKHNPIRYNEGANQQFNLTAMAAIKRREWKYEHECRMIATLRTTRNNVTAPDINYILVPIKLDHIQTLKITFNPWMDGGVKQEIKEFVSSIAGLQGKRIVYENSVLTGEIAELNTRSIKNHTNRD